MTIFRVSAAVGVYLLAVLQLQYATGQSCTNTTINSSRLYSGGSLTHAGQVQICQCEGDGAGECSWMRVAAIGSNRQFWSWKNSLVVCRQLGFLGVQNPVQSSSVPSLWLAPLSTPVHFKDFHCDGTEHNLTSCSYTVISSLTPFSDAYINCRNSSSIPIFKDVQLSGGSTADNEGGVEVYLTPSDGWVRVCPDGWYTTSAAVVCKQLGYETGQTVVFSRSQFTGSLLGSHGVTSVQCSDTASNLGACSFVRSTSCSTPSVIGVNCTATSQPEGSTRLVDIALNRLDRVEVLYNKRWGLVCNTLWSILDARVVCRQNGQGSERSFGVGIITGSQSQPIWTSGYDCIGSEENLDMCRRSAVVGYSSGCSYTDTSGAECSGPPPLISTGGIIGIVLALIVIAFFIVPFLCGYGRECWKKGQLRGWWSRQRHRVRTWTQNIRLPTVRRDPRPMRRNPRPRSSSVPLITETDNILTSSASTTSTDDNTTNNTTRNQLSTNFTEFGAAKLPTNPDSVPPPSYNEALHQPGSGLPYMPPSVLPYPADPAYPPPPVMVVPGYPPPTNPALAYPPSPQVPDGAKF